MYICVCNAISDKDVKTAIKNGAKSIKELNQQLNVGSNCGTCVSSIQLLIDDSKQAKTFNLPIYTPSFG